MTASLRALSTCCPSSPDFALGNKQNLWLRFTKLENLPQGRFSYTFCAPCGTTLERFCWKTTLYCDSVVKNVFKRSRKLDISSFIENNVHTVENFDVTVRKKLDGACMLIFESTSKRFEAIINSKPETDESTAYVLATVASTDLKRKHMPAARRMRQKYVDFKSERIRPEISKGKIVFFNLSVVILSHEQERGIEQGDAALIENFKIAVLDVFGDLVSDWEAAWSIVDEIKRRNSKGAN
jgi:hypothetical protein